MSKPEKRWYETFYTYIWVFNTGRGLSILIRLPNNIGILYDLGNSKEFSPCDFIAKHIAPHLTKYKAGETSTSIAQCILSHPHADHIREIDAIHLQTDKDGQETTSPELRPALLTCPNDKGDQDNDQDDDQKVDFTRIKRDDNAELIEKYKSSYSKRQLPLQTIESCGSNVPNVEYGVYYLKPGEVATEHPKTDQDYTNGLSILFYLRHGNQSILIPGDVTPEVMSRILEDDDGVEKRYTYFRKVPRAILDDFHKTTSTQPSLSDLLSDRGLSILVAPHHGLESGFSEKFFETIYGNKTRLNVISEKRHENEDAGTVDPRYQSSDNASGLKVNIDGKQQDCFSVTTRNGHHILIIFKGTDNTPHVYLRKNPKDLLEII
ncbi:MAG TPA: hypothetical protein PLC99_13455 [Verrucomicrobiota bacterium]|nr:hypothetical protein [Verrucomicrobiota bacterium]